MILIYTSSTYEPAGTSESDCTSQNTIRSLGSLVLRQAWFLVVWHQKPVL